MTRSEGGTGRARRGRRPGRCTLLVLLLALLPIAGAAQPTRSQSTAQTQAAYLVNFVRYTEWPAERFDHERDPLVIVVAGPGWMYNAVRAAGRQAGHVRQRPLQVQRLPLEHDADALSPRARAMLDHAHMLFVHASHAPLRQPLLDAVAGRAVLTVGSDDGFVDEGGMIGLVRSGRSIRIEADPEAIRRAGLQLSAKVLKLANTGERR